MFSCENYEVMLNDLGVGLKFSLGKISLKYTVRKNLKNLNSMNIC